MNTKNKRPISIGITAIFAISFLAALSMFAISTKEGKGKMRTDSTTTRKFRLALTALVLLALLVAVFGAVLVLANPGDWYVNGSMATSGDGTSWATAFKTIQEGVNAANAAGGDTVHVAAGTYDESVTVDKSLTLLGAKANVDPRGGAWAGDITTINAGNGNNGILITASDVTVNGFKVTESGTATLNDKSGIYAGTGAGLTNIIIKYCWCDDNYGSGITLYKTDNSAVVEYCYCSNNGELLVTNIAGIAFDHDTNGLISNNELGYNNNYGIHINCRCSEGITISNNNAHHNIIYGISFIGYGVPTENLIVKDNILQDNLLNGLKIYDVKGCAVEGNLFASNGYCGGLPAPEEYKYGVQLVSKYMDTSGTVLTGNTFTGNNGGGIYMLIASGAQPEATLADTVAHYNNFEEGSGKWGINNAAAFVVDATCNWWGDDSGPFDPDGTVEVPPCTADPANEKNADGTGDKVSDNVDYCPWSTAPLPAPDLVLEEKTATWVDGTLTVTYTVSNCGECACADAPASTTGIYVDDDLVATDNVPALPKCNTYTNTVVIPGVEYPCGTTIWVTVKADHENLIDECNEMNNCEVNMVVCPGPGGILTNTVTVTGTSSTGEEVTDSDTVTVTVLAKTIEPPSYADTH